MDKVKVRNIEIKGEEIDEHTGHVLYVRQDGKIVIQLDFPYEKIVLTENDYEVEYIESQT